MCDLPNQKAFKILSIKICTISLRSEALYHNVVRFSVTVYLNSSCAAGKWLDSNKLLSSGTRFGPGTVNHVMRSCLQLLIDCATDPGYVYHAIPSGDGHASLSADFLGSTRIRHLPVFRSALDGWKYLTGVLDKLQTCPHLLSKQLGDCLSCTSPPTLPPKSRK